VVRGEAVVTRGKEVVRLLPGGSIDIPLGAFHRVECAGRKTRRHRGADGAVRGRDDIERFEDDYGLDVTDLRRPLRNEVTTFPRPVV